MPSAGRSTDGWRKIDNPGRGKREAITIADLIGPARALLTNFDMTNAELIEKIRAEIKRMLILLGQGYDEIDRGQIAAYEHLLSFLSTLESEKPMNQDELEKEIEWEWNDCDGKHSDTDYQIVELTKDDFSSLARHFAEWQKEQMMKDGNVILAEEDFDAEKEKSMEWGYNLCKEQMMKEAVEGEVVKDISNKLAVTAKINLDGFKFGDKVRVIVLKKEN